MIKSLATGILTVATAVGASPAAEPGPGASAGRTAAPAVILHSQLIDGWRDHDLAIDRPTAVFASVFSALPSEVEVYPSGNYLYFALHASGREIRGNIRLAPEARDRGSLWFAYCEFDIPSLPLKRSHPEVHLLARLHGVTVHREDAATYLVTYQEKSVRFHLHQLEQAPPRLFPLAAGELFVERTFDESGLQFFLLFNSARNYFLWVLNEEEPVPDTLEPLAGELLVGRRTGFAFWVDARQGARKILIGVRRQSLEANDYYDGPFDQLADNDAEAVGIAEYLQLAFPEARGKIDPYGNRVDRRHPTRVAPIPYCAYTNTEELLAFLRTAKAAADPCEHIAWQGLEKEQAAGGR